MEEDIKILKEYLDGYSGEIGTRNFNNAIENVLKELERYREYKKGLTKNELIFICANQEEDIEELNKELETLKNEKEKSYLQGFKDSEDKYNTVIADNMKKDKVIDLMASAINNYDSQLVINHFNNKEDVKQCFIKKVEENEGIQN